MPLLDILPVRVADLNEHELHYVEHLVEVAHLLVQVLQRLRACVLARPRILKEPNRDELIRLEEGHLL